MVKHKAGTRKAAVKGSREKRRADRLASSLKSASLAADPEERESSTRQLQAKKIPSAELKTSANVPDLQHGMSQLSVTTASVIKTINDLPNELLDDIAAFVPPAELPSLALVSRRWREPAHRHAIWKATGFEELMKFADLLLERPELAQVVLNARLEGNADEGETPREDPDTPYLPLLTTRALHITLEQLPNLQTLHFGVHIPHRSVQKQLMQSIGRLGGLKDVNLGGQTSFLDVGAFVLAMPAFSSLQRFCSAIRIDPTRPLPRLPQCSARRCDLYVLGVNEHTLRALLDALARDSHFTEVCIEDDGEVAFISPAEVDAACYPYMAQTNFFCWSHFTREWEPRCHLPEMPIDATWLMMERFLPSASGMGRCTVFRRFWTCKSVGRAECLTHLGSNVLRFSFGDGWWVIKAGGGKQAWGAENVEMLYEIVELAETTLEWC